MKFEQFWLNVRFRDTSIAEKYRDRPLAEQRAWAARAFESWRLGRIDINYDRNELCPKQR